MNKVIIIGDDHINTLGVVRVFGKHNIKPYVIVYSQSSRVSIIKSKYIEKSWICKDLKKIIEILQTNFRSCKKKPVIIPTSDKIAMLIDKNLDILKNNFYCPNINQKQKEILLYMNKYSQYKFALDNNLKVANSYVLNLSSNNIETPKIKFPIIVKPIISAEGNKNDIEICNDKNEFFKICKNLIEKKYNNILVQEVICYDYECGMVGYSYDNKVEIPGMTIRKRCWPSKKGTTTLGKIILYKKYNKEILKIKKAIEKLNFEGIFDLDVFLVGNDLYFNEINLRNGGHSHAYMPSDICYYWYLSCCREKFVKCPEIDSEYYFIDEQADLHNIIESNISILQYIKDMKRSKVKLSFDKRDFSPTIYMFIYKILNNLQK
ncbi:ATP-grasp domain-containing protein [Clostridium perfringens]|uniref:ATP-grasp domain-containing protein n=1 Tax=Clostridium perfringens TaxID=1502 RepID=UPI0018E4C413|nr:ATP-grasp domain-containing protein [Clostridium perfringens]MBI5997590.1 ATP-grasp domain-containing protein [Clostridium perfringens]